MITGQEIARALTGSWLLLQNRPEGLRWFDRSIEGFWRSFGVFFLLLPFFWINELAEKKQILENAELAAEFFPNGTFWAVQMTTLALDWTVFPIVLASLAGPVGISKNYVSFIVVRNWSSILVSIAYMLAGLLYLLGIVSSEFLDLITLSLMGVALWYSFNIARIALQTGLSVTLGVVVLELVLSFVIFGLVVRVLG